MPAFKLCEEMKLHGFETDIWLTKDHKLVLMHGLDH